MATATPGSRKMHRQVAARATFQQIMVDRVTGYRTLPAAFSSTTFESTAVSALSGRCEQKPMPT
jgi:hypothetical protein